jgi:hypothetical protein
MFARLDTNSDKKIDAAEMQSISEFLRERLKQSDTNGDGVVELAEYEAGLAERRAAGGGGGPGGGGPGGGGGPAGGSFGGGRGGN